MFFKSQPFTAAVTLIATVLSFCFSLDAVAIPSPSLLSATVTPKSDFEIAVVFLKQRQFAKAETAFKKLLANSDKKDNKLVADILNYIAVSLHAQKKEDEAEQYFQQALDKLPAVSRKEKIMRAKVLANLASSYLAQRKITPALEACGEAVQLFRAGGGSAIELAVLLNSFARLKIETNDYKGAESLLCESIRIRERVNGKTSRELISPLVNLSAVYLHQKKYPLAEETCHRTVQICRKNDGSSNAMLFPLLSNLAEAQLETKHFTSAAITYQEALTVADREFGKNSDESLATLLSLSEAAESSRQRKVAEDALRRAVDICRTSFGSQDERTLQVTEALADLEQGHGNLSEARRLRFLSRLSRRRLP